MESGEAAPQIQPCLSCGAPRSGVPVLTLLSRHSLHGEGFGNGAAKLHASKKDTVSDVLASQNVLLFCGISPCKSNFCPM